MQSSALHFGAARFPKQIDAQMASNSFVTTTRARGDPLLQMTPRETRETILPGKAAKACGGWNTLAKDVLLLLIEQIFYHPRSDP